MRGGPYVRVQEIAEQLAISVSAAYALMHELGAVHVGRGSIKRGRGSLRLDRSRWLQYLGELQCSSSQDTASGLQSVITRIRPQGDACASCAPQGSETTGPTKPAARQSTVAAKSKRRSTVHAVTPGLAAAVAKAQLPSDSPSLEQLRRRVSQARATQR